MQVHQAASRVLSLVFALACAGAAWPQGARPAVGPGEAVVHTALGGFILGYDIDQTGTVGILSEARTRADGRHDIAVETFDQRTGEIIQVLRQELDSKNGFVTLGIFGNHVGLTEFEHVRKLFVDSRRYLLSDPVDANRFTGEWTPPFEGPEDIIMEAAVSQGFDTALFMGIRNTAQDFGTYLFTSNVGANTFGPVIRLEDKIFDWNNSPVAAFDTVSGQAVIGSSFGCYRCPIEIGLVDVASGAQSKFRGLGTGFVNGIAVDPQTHVACTTSEDDFSVEFYDLVNDTRRRVRLPGATSQQQSGGAVAVDTVHKLFLVGQEFSSTAFSGSSIHVFDEQGNLVESLDGFSLPASPAYMALNPARRMGYVIVTPDLKTLQSFTY
jgi:hypothetical protein